MIVAAVRILPFQPHHVFNFSICARYFDRFSFRKELIKNAEDMQGLYVASLTAFSKSLASCWKTNSCLIMITPNMNWPLRTLSQWVAGLPPLHLPLTNGRMSPLVEACCKRPKRRHAFWMQLPAVADEIKVFRVWRRAAGPEITAT